jgi:hypothetical protein
MTQGCRLGFGVELPACLSQTKAHGGATAIPSRNNARPYQIVGSRKSSRASNHELDDIHFSSLTHCSRCSSVVAAEHHFNEGERW